MKIKLKLITTACSLSLSVSLLATTPKDSEQMRRVPKPIGQIKAAKLFSALKKEATVMHSLGKKIPVRQGGNGNNETGDFDPIVNQMCVADEAQFSQIERTLMKDWIESWSLKNPTLFFSHLSSTAEMELFLKTGKEKNLDTILLTKWEDKNEKSITNEDKIHSSVTDYLNSFSKIEDINLTTFKYYAPKMNREKNLSFKEFNAEVKYNLRGFTGGVRRQDRGDLFITFIKEKKEWKISKIQIANMESLENKTPSFEEKTASAGIDNLSTYQRIEAIRRGGYAIALADFDNDGNTDMYVGAYGPGQLFKGKSDGTFLELKDSGIESLTYVKSAIWADLNNDGLKDLALIRFVPGGVPVAKDLEPNYLKRTDVVLYKNLGNDKFSKVDGISDKELTDYAMPAAVADFNNDGLLDIYIGYPGHKDFTTFSNYFEEKKSMKAQGVYLNKGNFKFEAGLMSDFKSDHFEKFSHLQRTFPHSAMAVDFNQDGKVDIVVIDDRGNLSPAYMNIGNGKFTQANGAFNLHNEGYGMGVASADFNNDGLTDLLMTNVKFDSMKRMNRSCMANWDKEAFRDSDNDILAYQGTKTGDMKKSFVEVAKNIGLDDAGEGLGAVEFLDYNNDGFEDIYVVNGLWSGTDRSQDISSEFSRSLFNKLDTNFARILMESRMSTQSTIMTILSNYRGNADGSKSKVALSLAGYQHNRLFRNNGNGTFTEVGFLEGVDSIADGYVIAKADLNHDGKIDLILRNADPGSKDVTYSPLQVFINKNGKGNSLRVKLVGNKSNVDAIGAEVSLNVKEGLTETKQIIGNAGTSQSELILHFGLGDSEMARSMTIKWPSGKLTQLKNLKKGTIEIKEETANSPTYLSKI